MLPPAGRTKHRRAKKNGRQKACREEPSFLRSRFHLLKPTLSEAARTSQSRSRGSCHVGIRWRCYRESGVFNFRVREHDHRMIDTTMCTERLPNPSVALTAPVKHCCFRSQTTPIPDAKLLACNVKSMCRLGAGELGNCKQRVPP